MSDVRQYWTASAVEVRPDSPTDHASFTRGSLFVRASDHSSALAAKDAQIAELTRMLERCEKTTGEYVRDNDAEAVSLRGKLRLAVEALKSIDGFSPEVDDKGTVLIRNTLSAIGPLPDLPPVQKEG